MQGELILEYGKNPINYGRLENPNFSYTEKNDVCGEYMTVDFIFDNEQKVKEISFEGDGRMVGIAAMSLLTEELEDQPLSKINTYNKDSVFELLEIDTLTLKRTRSAMLGLLTLQNAYRELHQKPKRELEELTGEL